MPLEEGLYPYKNVFRNLLRYYSHEATGFSGGLMLSISFCQNRGVFAKCFV